MYLFFKKRVKILNIIPSFTHFHYQNVSILFFLPPVNTWEMLDLTCRLCSSTCALISLSGGKCRRNRDYIRKLVEITVGIKFEKDDSYKCICYPCTVQVYNFYIFKTRSLENEKNLESHVEKREKTTANKIEILDLQNILLPNTNELSEVLVPWLISKSKYCELVNSENDDPGVEKTSEPVTNSSATNVCRTVENETQYETVPSIDVSIQCHIPKNTSQKSTQNDLPNLGSDKYTQYMVPNTTIQTQTQTNGILMKHCKIQCSLLKENRYFNKTFNTPKALKGIDKATQHDGIYENCPDCKYHIHDLVNIKQEPQSTPIDLSPINSLNISITPSKSNISQIPDTSTPTSTNLFTIKDVSENTIICKKCDKTLPLNETYSQHKKSHMVCDFCKKKFPSMKRTKWHINNDCTIKKIINAQPVVELNRLENLKNIPEKYPQCLEDLKQLQFEEQNWVQSTVRVRSKSTSSADSFYSCCSFCRNSMTVLHGLKLGVDKAVQVNLFHNQIGLELVNRNEILTSKVKNEEDLMSPAKRIKLSNSLVKLKEKKENNVKK